MSDARGAELRSSPGRSGDGRATAAFVLGVLSVTTFYVCPLLPVLAIVLGSGRPSGLGRAGLVLGWVGVVLYAASALLLIAFWVVGGAFVLSG